jgi:homoserine O-acetyltransferase
VRVLDYRKYVTIAEDREFMLESGKSFGPITIAYETYGELDMERNNCILILHALTGDSHPARHNEEDIEGWWETFVGPDKIFDTNKYFIVCSNILGGCQGTTGPSSIDKITGKPYGARFPVITIKDMVKVQREFLRAIGVEHLHCVAGGSMGGLQALEWAVSYPDFIDGAIQLAAPLSLSAEAMGINHIMRKSIMADINWNNGDYYEGEFPEKGLAAARMLGMITYQTTEEYELKFKRKTKDSLDSLFQGFEGRFEVESYLNYQGAKFNNRFDANSYLYITRAMDLFDLKRQYGSLENALRRIKTPHLLIAIDTDRLFYINELRKSHNVLKANGVEVFYEEISSIHGHDAFLIDEEKYRPIIIDYLEELQARRKERKVGVCEKV